MAALGINGGFLLWQIVNFLIIFLALAFLAWRPLVRNLEARRETIAKGLEDARQAELARANAERDAQKLVDQRKAEANKIVEDGRLRGEEQARAIVSDANREAEEIRARARTEAEEERNALLGEVRSQVAQLAIAAAERVIGQSLDAKSAQNTIANFFSEVPADVRNLGDEVEVTSAVPLSDSEKANISKQLGAKNVSYRVDPSILGGLVVRAGDRVVDGSVRNNLQTLAAQMR
ncbi:MAG TPA: F0F1 ATP synthase subunit B [Aggregatilineales bacterium]|nr:F0F1 ATP synthase subunit B [Aggregatilineales bacterium]